MDTTADVAKLSGRPFPINLGDQRSIWPEFPDSIPWEVIAPHERQANINHGQPLETLARLGGLSPYELLAVLLDQPFWRCMLPEPATVIAKVKEKINGVEAKRGLAPL